MKSTFSQHQVTTGHKVLCKPVFEGVSVIDSEPRNMHRNIKEAIHIKLGGGTLNRTGGYNLPDLYLPLLRERLIGHAPTADTTSSMMLLPEKAKLPVGKI